MRVTTQQKDAIIGFYRLNNFRPVWVSSEGLNDKARRTLALLGQAEQEGLSASDYLPPGLGSFSDDLSDMKGDVVSLARLDIGLTAIALRYAQHLHSGRIVPKKLSGYYDIEPPALNLGQTLNELSWRAQPDIYLSSLAPPHPAYSAMKASLNSRAEPGDVEKLVLNMERLRWLPRELGQRHIFVNQAAFELRIIDGEDTTWRTRVIVGTPETQTTVFSDEMETVVINPYWSVPQSIIRYEMIPRLAKDHRYLDRKGFEVVNEKGRIVSSKSVNWWAHGDNIPFAVRQPPGANNALGRVKFLFPNSHSIYMHDTPAKELFAEPVRAFSHGCVRVENPRELAEHTLGWDRKRIDNMIATSQNRGISLDKHIPVHLQYFTAWPDESGKIVFYSDVYERDARLAKVLDTVVQATNVSGAKYADLQ